MGSNIFFFRKIGVRNFFWPCKFSKPLFLRYFNVILLKSEWHICQRACYIYRLNNDKIGDYRNK